MAAVRCCIPGQITNTLFEVGGQYRRSMWRDHNLMERSAGIGIGLAPA